MRKTLIQEHITVQDKQLCEHMLSMMREKQTMKLDAARRKGRGGWERCSPAELERLLKKAVDESDYISVANYAGMLYMHRSEY